MERRKDRQTESWVSREWQGWIDARSQGFILEPIGLQTLAQQDVDTQTHTQCNTHLCVCCTVCAQCIITARILIPPHQKRKNTITLLVLPKGRVCV